MYDIEHSKYGKRHPEIFSPFIVYSSILHLNHGLWTDTAICPLSLYQKCTSGLKSVGTPNWLSCRLCTHVLADHRVGNRKGRQGPPRQVDVRCRGRTSAGIRHLQKEGTRNPSRYFIPKTDSFKILYLWTAVMSLPLVSSPEDYIPIVHVNYLYF